MGKKIKPPQQKVNSALQEIYDLVQISALFGLRHAVVSPGSRCAPLILGFGKHPQIEIISVTDERSAAFVALGIAQQTGLPVAVVCTSGTAALNFGPAVAEAYYQNNALLVLTADRPPEWIDQWDGQAIHQENLYAPHIKGSFNYSLDSKTKMEKWEIVKNALTLSLEPNPGPVHINVPVREPFYPPDLDSIKFSPDLKLSKRSSGSDSKIIRTPELELNSFKKILVVAGQGRYSGNLIKLLNKLNAPVMGDIISNLHDLKDVIKSGDLIFKNAPVKLKPDLLLTFGRSIISKNLKLFLRRNKPAAHWHIGLGAAGDPFKSITRSIKMQPREFFELLVQKTKAPDLEYKKLLQDLDLKSRQNLKNMVSGPGLNELSAAAAILSSLKEKSVLHLGNSMPVRLANFIGLNKAGIEVWSNRGTSGIDGIVSTSVGHAVADPQRLHTLIVGDISFLYDRNALWLNREFPANLKIIILNNQGGGIFDFIDGPSLQGKLKDLFITPHERNASLTAAEFGIPYTEVRNRSELSALKTFFKGGTGIMEIFTDRSANINIYKKLKN